MNFRKLASRAIRHGTIFTVVGCAVPAASQTCNEAIVATTPAARFTLNGALATDQRTGLTWARCPLGQNWDGAGCTDLPEEYTWQEALQHSASADTAGFTDWRLPNIKELASIVELACVGPAINLAIFPDTPSWSFWSASPYAGDSNGAWYVYFNDGGDYWSDKSNYLHVRLVRGGQ